MKKPPIFQVRISPDLAVQIESLREGYEARISKTAFVELLIEWGMNEARDRQNLRDSNGDPAESALKQ